MSIKVIYIIGAAYSGSTVLGAILGMHPDLLDAGELYAHGDRAVVSGQMLCSCGERRDECPFWLQVAGEFAARTQGADRLEYRARMARYQRFRNVGRRWLASAFRTADYRRYESEAVAMLESLVAASARRSVVDVSKAPLRGLNLAQLPGVDVRFIHLVRNGLAIIPSNFKHHGKKWLRQGQSERKIANKAARDWLFANLGAECILKAAGRPATRIRYEDLLASPEKTIHGLSETVGEDLGEMASRVAAGAPISFGHAGGNIAGRQGPRPLLTAEEDWGSRLPPGSHQIFERRAGWLNRLYGYPRQVESTARWAAIHPRRDDPRV